MNPIKKSPSTPLLYLLSATAGGGGGLTASGNFNSADLTETMRRSLCLVLLFVSISLFFLASVSLYSYRSSPNYEPEIRYVASVTDSSNQAVEEETLNRSRDFSAFQGSSSSSSSSSSPSSFPWINSFSVLLPDWEVLLVVSPETPMTLIPGESYECIYPNHQTAPARFSGVLPSTNQTTFKCELPPRNRRRFPFLSPKLKRSSEKKFPVPSVELKMWTFLAYESRSTEDDVVLFVKGVNNRQGINRSPHEFMCVFINDVSNKTVRTSVTSSIQEVFRCHHPDLTALSYGGDDERNKLRISLEVSAEKLVVPSLAYYTPRRKIANPRPKSELCASTMVYNVAKFLREWVMYHSKIGVDKFILYDNDSNDDLQSIVDELNGEGYEIQLVTWIWPKTQEAGFSHAALYAKSWCNWIMYIDVDEFVFSPSWSNSSQPSTEMLRSLLPKPPPDGFSSSAAESRWIGQITMKCNEFGPSNQRIHPVEGVTQGYNCRMRLDNRHKSIVLLEAIDDSMLNVIHHFQLKEKHYEWKIVDREVAVVNHYKFQAWSEFKAKFRRRVSAYVVDWMKAVNPSSKDRAPGLGFEAVEPAGWEKKFCEVRDERLKEVTQKWFGRGTGTGSYKMAWQK